MATTASRRATSDFMKQVLGRPVIVKLNNGIDYRGVLACLDGGAVWGGVSALAERAGESSVGDV